MVAGGIFARVACVKCLLITGWLAVIGSAFAGDWVPLWNGEAPGAAKPADGSEWSTEKGQFGKIEQPEYLLFPASGEQRNGQAVVIFPGGGYSSLMIEREGLRYAEWLNQRGITAMVVKYRVSDDPEFGYQWPVPFLDARRAIRTMKRLAPKFGVDPTKIGVLGSSAGGHLASLCATRFNDQFEEFEKEPIDSLSARPDFAILVYPVITMGENGHDGSRKRLLGADPSEELVQQLSTEKQVTNETPPSFLVTTTDDRVDCRNSLEFAISCKAHDVPVSLHLFEKGGHGYNLAVGMGDLEAWTGLLGDWLNR